LRKLYDKYHADGLELLAFPVNQFGGQAPGSDDYERQQAFRKFGFEWPTVFDHVAALDKPTPQWEGPTETSPVYKYLKSVLPGEIPWNYTKFLVGRDGVPLRRYSPPDGLENSEEDIVAALAGRPLKPRRSSPLPF
jgi:glutathione peroxidase